MHCGKAGLTFDYPAKGGKERMQVVTAAPVAAVVGALHRRRRPGQRLLAYADGGRWHELGSEDMNKYLRELFGQDVSAKDLRTWHATVLAAVGLAVSGHAAASPAARKRAVIRTVKEVATYLGNTPAVCRKSYVHPAVIDAFVAGTLPAARACCGLSAEEARVLRLLGPLRRAAGRRRSGCR